ncbi:hypothetical protein MNBD_GAMMA12-2382 [hydrothermal vent metagenome]|uniref:Uncharacterized protein n=1 Tax=hydrothermal vent metagenome TaxID=652676 RepID=A0A3B0Y982_9ZZZZ
MDIPLDQYQELAWAMARQRQTILKKPWADAIALASVEHRLRKYLFVLSHYVDEKEAEPSKEYEVFVYLARRILAYNEETKIQGWNKAIDYLAEPGDKENGASSALILLPPYGDHKQLLATAYNDVEALQPAIIKLWQKTNTKISIELIQRSDLLSTSNEFQIAALEYAARSEDFTLDFFEGFYMALISGQGEVHEHLLAPAIDAGLLRGDNNAKTAILRGIEQITDPEITLKLLRLAALSGDNQFLPVLESFTHTAPEHAYHLLALHGNKGAIPIMIEGLKNASQLEYAEQGWDLLTDVKLPQVPRMYLAANSEDDFDEESNFSAENNTDDDDFELGGDFDEEENKEDTVSDVRVAEQWWADNSDSWQHENRYLKGQLAHSQGLAKIIQTTAGLITADLLEALVLEQAQEQKQPLASTADHSDSWCEHRNEFLQQYSEGESDSDIANTQSSQATQAPLNKHARTTRTGQDARNTTYA